MFTILILKELLKNQYALSSIFLQTQSFCGIWNLVCVDDREAPREEWQPWSRRYLDSRGVPESPGAPADLSGVRKVVSTAGEDQYAAWGVFIGLLGIFGIGIQLEFLTGHSLALILLHNCLFCGFILIRFSFVLVRVQGCIVDILHLSTNDLKRASQGSVALSLIMKITKNRGLLPAGTLC